MPARMASYPESTISFWPNPDGTYRVAGGPWPNDDGARATYLRKLARSMLAEADACEQRAAAAYDKEGEH